jgi:hypothetical protein
VAGFNVETPVAQKVAKSAVPVDSLISSSSSRKKTEPVEIL